jgi:glycogen debranching enzyme
VGTADVVTAQAHQHPSTTPVPEVAAGAAASLTDAIVLKEGGVFFVALRDGTVPAHGDHPLGLYRDDCRYLSGHELRIAGTPPRLLIASAITGEEGIHELTNPDLPLPDGRTLPLQTLRVRLERRLMASGRVREQVHLHLYGNEPVELEVKLALRADFRPMLGIRGIVDLPAPEVSVERLDDGMRFAATTSDGVRRSTTVRCDRAPDGADGNGLRFQVRLAPGDRDDLRIDYVLQSADAPAATMRTATTSAQDAARLPEVARTHVQADDELFKRVIQRSLIDLRMLRSSLDGQSYFAAGVPWFATLFGRDSLITAIELLGFVPDVAEQTLRVLAERLGRRVDPTHEEEPGKVLHELRVGEVAGRTPLSRYYGTVDATPLFLCLLVQHADWSGSLALFRELRGAVNATLSWIEHYGDHDGDGLLDYRANSPAGLRNQGWKDSDDSVMDGRGVPLEPPIALVEPQAYAISALRGMARLFALDGDDARASDLKARADDLTDRLERFWVPERRIYGMGIDGEGHTSSALASNQGHLLWAGVVSRERGRAVRDALMSPAMFSGWGVRTLGSDEPAYNPVGYHLGTVWPHDTAMGAIGLRRYGFDEDFTLMFEGLLEAASHAEGYSLPELFAGFSRAQYETPVPYPVACHPQAWASGSIPYMLINGLGLEADAMTGRLRVRRPSLPRWVNRVEVENLVVGGGRVDLLFERTGAGDSVALTDARIKGDIEVVLEITGGR